MFVKFFVALMAIFVAGPLHNEGGAEAIQQKGVKEAAKAAYQEAKLENPHKYNQEWYNENMNH